MNRVAFYARVSTDKQTTEVQKREITEFLKSKPEFNLVNSYCDEGFSGSKVKRPELDKLLIAARNNEFDVIVIWKLDRLARSLKHLVSLVNEFKDLGIELISLTDGIDFTTAQGRLMFGIFASLAEFERELIRERVKAGLDNAKAKGRKLGRTKIRDDEAILKLRSEGLSVRKIAKHLSISTGQVQRSIKCNENLLQMSV